MGLLLDSELRKPHKPRLKNSGSISGEMVGFQASATQITDQTGQWEYGEEIPVRIVPNDWRELPLPSGQRLFWSGIQVSIKEVDLPPGKQPWFLTAALQPLSLRWSACAPLRRIYKRKDRDKKIAEHLALYDSLDLLTWDPFHNTKGEHTARLKDPQHLHYDHGVNLGDSLLLGQKPRNSQGAIWHLGLCPISCLEHFEIPLSPPAPVRSTSYVIAPPTPAASLRQSALRFALAGRAKSDTITFQSVLRQAWNALDPAARRTGAN